MRLENDNPPKKIDFKKFLRRTIRLFLQGLLYIGPVSVIIYIIFKFFIIIDGILPFKIPGLGFVIIFLGVTFFGYFGNTVFAKPLFTYLKKTIDKVPLIKTIYESVKDLLSAFVGNKKKFNVPVMVKMNMDAEIYKMGFLTKKDLSQLGVGNAFVAVYLPHSYNFSGNMFIVPIENVRILNLPSSEVMKFIVTGGVIDIDEEKNETEVDENK